MTEYRNSYRDEYAGTNTVDAYAWVLGESVGTGDVEVTITTGVGSYVVTVTGAKGIYTSSAIKLREQTAAVPHRRREPD
jgi:hypothetical protein